MSVSLRKHQTKVPLQLTGATEPVAQVQNIPVATIQSLVRLFSSILDTEQQRFNITALPRGIVILDYDYETHEVTIRYAEQVYKVGINNNMPVVEIVS